MTHQQITIDVHRQRPSLSIALRIWFVLTGAVFPLLCIITAIATNIYPGPSWQSGELSDYAGLLLCWPGIGPFLPLVLYSMVCMTLWTIWPDSSSRFAIRLGIYAGTLLALQFFVFVMLCIGGMTILAAFILALCLVPAIPLMIGVAKRTWRFTIGHLLALTTLWALAAAALKYVVAVEHVLLLPMAATIYILAATPTINLVAYLHAAVLLCLGEQKRARAWHVLGWFAWLGAWATSWKIAVEVMLAEYAKLPTTSPSCYVASAAAHGHRHFVGAELFGAESGAIRIVNLQMRRLKFLELALAAVWPGLHRCVRTVYNWAGPPLANLCRSNIWFADATYVALKPVEWFAECVRVVGRVPSEHVRKL